MRRGQRGIGTDSGGLAIAGRCADNTFMPESFEIVAEPPRPNLPGRVVLRETADDAIDAVASDMLLHAMACVREFGDFHLALSGGATPEPLYRRLMYDPNYRELPWKRTHLWIVDEHPVGFEDDRSSFKQIRELIADHSDIPPEQVHPIPSLAREPAAAYERELREHLGWREKGQDRLDCVVLGLGPDGATAGLLPHSPVLRDDGRLVAVHGRGSGAASGRVSMTLRMINAARFIAVLVTGPDRRGALARIAARVADVRELPILGVSPLAGELRWYLSWDACPKPEDPAGR